MKFAKKFMVVPYIKLQENPEEKYVSDLDRDIGDILIDDKKPTDEKVKLYNIALQKYMMNYNPKPQSEDSIALNKISQHLESYVNNLKNNDEQNNNRIKTEPNSNLNPNVNHMYYYNTNRNTDTNENEGDVENMEQDDNNIFSSDLDSPEPVRQPIKRKLVDKSLVFPKNPRHTRKNNLKNSPIVPGLISDRKKAIQNSEYAQKVESDIKKQQNLFLKQEKDTKAAVEGKMRLKEMSKIFKPKKNDSSDDESKMNVTGKSLKTARTPQKGNGLQIKNTISKTQQCSLQQKWSCNKTGYFK